MVKEEKPTAVQDERETNAQLTKAQLTHELQETTTRLSGQLQERQLRLDQFHPEFQSLQDELQNAELPIKVLEMERSKKDEEIQKLEEQLNSYTSLTSSTAEAGGPLP